MTFELLKPCMLAVILFNCSLAFHKIAENPLNARNSVQITSGPNRLGRTFFPLFDNPQLCNFSEFESKIPNNSKYTVRTYNNILTKDGYLLVAFRIGLTDEEFKK